MIISRTPYRISFFGGGTDYPAWFKTHGGAVLATTIDKYCYLTCRYLPPFFEHRIRVVYSNIETVQVAEELKHPAVRECLKLLDVQRGIEIHHDGDLPARSGMGSSSSFTVGLLNALYALKGVVRSKNQLATEAIRVELELMEETVGVQDQVATAYGGFNRIDFLQDGSRTVVPLTLSESRFGELKSHLMLFYTGIMRTASDVAKSYVTDLDRKHIQLKKFGQMVDESVSILNSRGDLLAFGELLDEAWHVKKSLSERISSPPIDDVYAEALSAGAVGGKLIGAGGGGFMLFFAPPEAQRRIAQRLHKLLCVPFEFERLGSQVIFFEPERDYSAAEQDRARQPIASFVESDDGKE
jgi:D-glycero-alpha-D-manno-heptose-7-phosphate kinase